MNPTILPDTIKFGSCFEVPTSSIQIIKLADEYHAFFHHPYYKGGDKYAGRTREDMQELLPEGFGFTDPVNNNYGGLCTLTYTEPKPKSKIVIEIEVEHEPTSDLGYASREWEFAARRAFTYPSDRANPTLVHKSFSDIDVKNVTAKVVK